MKSVKIRTLAFLVLIAVTFAVVIRPTQATRMIEPVNIPEGFIGELENEYWSDSTLQTDLLGSTGKITFLRVHDVGTGYGPPNDFIDGEVVIKLNSEPAMAFGFQLRNDNNSLVHQAMLDVLRDAYANNWNVSVEYWKRRGSNTGLIIRVILAR